MKNRGGHVQYIDGPMFSGKTTELFRRVKRYTASHRKCMVLRYAQDNRYDATHSLASSHDGEQLLATPVTNPGPLLPDILAGDYHVVALDEAQFMGPDVAGFCNALADAGVIVIVAGLNLSWRREPWPQMAAIMGAAERVTRLDAVCWNCHEPAAFTRRKDVSNTALEDIGGADKYLASCRDCWTLPVSEAALQQWDGTAIRLRKLHTSI